MCNDKSSSCIGDILKVILKNIEIVDKEGIQKLGAKGIVEIDNQLKIIFGPNSKQLKKYLSDLK